MIRRLLSTAVVLTVAVGAVIWVMIHQDEYKIHYEELE
jgi:hypothetical protein